MKIISKITNTTLRLCDIPYGEVFYFADGATTYDGTPYLKVQDQEGEDCMVDLYAGLVERIDENMDTYNVVMVKSSLTLGD